MKCLQESRTDMVGLELGWRLQFTSAVSTDLPPREGI